ncbi:MAG: sulfurtransferase [Gallionellales bacterium RIFOXYB12_FULL_54_9]|nr:MAG: sulfurtransferase [Gallionellales bacterium RIFOXYB12_FULL_54_9]
MKSNKTIWLAAIALAIVLGSQLLPAQEGVDVKQAQILNRQGVLLLDVREPAEYAEVHTADTKLIPLGELGSHLTELSDYKDKPVLVICRSGRRSSKAVSLLREAGFHQVSNVKGGIKAWEGEGLSVIRKI